MNYLRNFYRQTSLFEADFFCNMSSETNATFGLSGNSSLLFTLENGSLFVDEKLIYSSLSSDLLNLRACCNSVNTTIWAGNKPIYSRPSGSDFNSIFFDSTGVSASFSERIYGNKPITNLTFSGWDNNTGILYFYNSGNGDMLINSIEPQNTLVQILDFDSSIPASSTGTIRVSYSGGSDFSGTGLFVFDTNAGNYEKNLFFNYEAPDIESYVNLYFSEDIFGPSGESRFFVENDNSQDLELEFFFSPTFGISGEKFATIPGTGSFSLSFADTITGVKSVVVDYSGLFSGIGGKLNNLGSGIFVGEEVLSLYAEGNAIYNYDIIAEADLLGEIFYSNFTGSMTGLVGPGSGSFYFNGNIERSGVSSAYKDIGTVIYPSSSVVFTGIYNRYVDCEQYVSSYDYQIIRDIQVSEGTPTFLDCWGISYDDPISGNLDFFALGIYNSNEYGITGNKYNVPAKSRSSGVIYFNNPFSEPFEQFMRLRVTDFSSINNSINIKNIF
jgi:hypothetical protein